MEKIKNYINGEWVESKSTQILDVENPGTGEILAQVPMSTKEEVNLAVKTAKEAQEKLREESVLKRVQYFYKLRDLVEKNLEDISTVLTKEHGKTLEESRGEMKRLLQNIESSFGVSSLIQGKILPNIASGIDEYFVREPLGVFAHIPPFNFPAMISFWYLPYAIACGNSFIVKPSEQCPLTMNRIFELIDKVGFPEGVLGLVNGGREVVDVLLEHPDIAGICSVTSTPTAKNIYTKGSSFGKRMCCQGGAKNFVFVSENCVLEKSTPNIIDSVYGNANQRCMAGSNVVAIKGIYEKLKEELVKAAKNIKVGYGLEPETTMGPLISAKAKEKVLQYIETGIKEGAKLVLDGRNIKVEKYPRGHYLGPCIFDEVEPEMTIAKEEIFGPVMMILRVQNLEEAIKMANRSKFGNAAILYSSLGKEANEFEKKIECFCLGINIGLPAPIAWFPFSGGKDSFFGVLHGQLPDVIDFFTNKKAVIKRWF
ncbi:MAG: methylmalonate-semialdehyde dehydrogenase (CoA acylating) [Parcubacteria group bacterium CG11_big_fil_rev_8_21_14_0_20_39_14]|nr:MAG: methylmalonate-semialdehyde dehydrogenase (CoA acylating) [Parcubacteria group bacterium CG11_big_fil_rev_8_21_14_0_20_39_14]PIS35214.1 MAG: methylmalonate-semialdehyde dehydrogenase (CoA acylating) [Parcubacteria group bacterium CG08_land_8_20_14_0_20_38_56]